MADDSTDTAFGFIIFILFLALLGYAAGGGSWPSSTADTTPAYPTTTYPDTTPDTATARSDTNIPGGRLESCPGKIVANKTARSSNGNLNLKVYYTEDNDRNCAVATRVGWAPRTQGRMTVRLRFTDYDGTQWPEYAVAWSQPHTTQLGGVYLDDTYNRCISASATYAPYTGMDKVTASIGPTGCN